MSEQTFTRRLADFIVGTSRADFAPGAAEAAVRPIIDTIGVIMAGSSGDAGRQVLEYARRLVPSSAPTWTGAPAGLPPEIAAMVSSTLGHALDYDDELAGTGHPSSILVSAILALPLPKLSGRQMIDAFVIGYEVNVKVANVVGHGHYRKGWHTTATVGGFGSVAAAAKLLGLNATQTRMALGIVASLAGGLQRNFGTMTKPLHSGLAARNGVLAAQLAAAGFTAAEDVLDGERGFVDIYAAGGADLTAVDRIANPWAILDPGPTLKKYPCCYATHRAIDGVLRLATEHGISADRVARIVDRAPTFGLRPLIHHNPQTGLQGKFSMEYVLAAALLDKEVVLDSFTDAAVQRPEVRRLMALVDAKEDPRCRPEDPQALHSGAGSGGFHEVTLVTTDGREYQCTVQYPSGSPHHPLSWSESVHKWHDCLRAGGRDQARGERLLKRLQELDQVEDVHALLAEAAE
ncbi:MAG: MmgE/PrpD family protein [Micromonosporaceae bacterium]|nr:MmgE/PrpD family protein [Micromonosporaceae bacterium]